jgi:hypothetical protein
MHGFHFLAALPKLQPKNAYQVTGSRNVPITHFRGKDEAVFITMTNRDMPRSLIKFNPLLGHTASDRSST